MNNPFVHKAVKSSFIESVAHDPATNRLEVKMKGGKTYRYGGVTKEVADRLANTPSVGTFFGKHFKAGAFPRVD